MSHALKPHGGGIPTKRLLPIIERYEKAHPVIGDELITRQFHKIRYEQTHVSFDLVDRMFIRLGLEHEWHTELADLYATPNRGSGFDPLIPPREMPTIHTAYKRGMSLDEISRSIYKRYGFSNPEACRNSLRRAFKRHGYKMRTPGESLHIRGLRKPCAGCGCFPTQRTHGCRTCSQRHHQWKRAGRSHVGPREYCNGCGCPLNERTPRCSTCVGRHSQWRAAGKPYVPVKCQACGGDHEKKTVGCRSCVQRHAWRRKHKRLLKIAPAVSVESPSPGSRRVSLDGGSGRGAATKRKAA